jgi:hypothetical protein
MAHSLYLSTLAFAVSFSALKDRERSILSRRAAIREDKLPRQVIEGGSQIAENVPGNRGRAERNDRNWSREALVPHLLRTYVAFTDDHVLPSFSTRSGHPFQIT